MWLVALSFATGAAAQDMRIQFAEKVAIAAAPGNTEFDAYGRRFSLDLQSNDRLLHALNRTGKMRFDSGRVLRGAVRGAPGSWVRLARVGDALEGAIWDGRDLYVVTSKGRIDSSLVLPLEGAPSQTVVYRLSDTVGGLPAQFCGLDVQLPSSPARSRSTLDQYKSMVSELRANASALAANEQLDISLIADSAFQSGSTPTFVRDRMLARVNTVDGIFSEQVGVTIVPTELRLIPAGSDPFTSTDAETLLDQLATYRNNTPEVRAAGLAHLMTGKSLNGDTIGIAFLDSLCEPREGVSLGDSELGDILSAFVMAHELGHNFGAPHDGVAGTCSATPQNFLMSPQINGSGTFSACSLSRMQDPIARARGVCIAGVHFADLALDFPAAFSIPTNQEFAFPVVVRSVGNEAAQNATLNIQLPMGSSITFQSAVLENGSCSATGSLVTCQLGDLAPGVSRAVELRLISSTLGTYIVAGSISADNDYAAANNSRSVFIGLTSPVDLGITMVASPTLVFESDPIDFTLDVSALRSQPAQGGVVRASVGGGAVIESISAGPHACAVLSGQPSALRCDLADLPNGTTSRITVRGRATMAGVHYASADVTLPNDGEMNNNSTQVQYHVRPERQVVTTVSTEDLRAVIGSPYDVVYTLTSVGRIAATDVVFRVSNPMGAVESVVPSAGSCESTGQGTDFTCAFGAMNPDEMRTVTVRVRFDAPASAALVGMTTYLNGTQTAISSKVTWIYANRRIDAQTSFGTVFATLEGQTGSGNFDLSSAGIDFAQNVVGTLDVPAPIQLLAIRTPYNPHGFNCAIVTPQRARCSGSFGAVGNEGALTRVQFDFASDTAISGTAQVTLTADDDGNSANDSATTPIVVRPFIDVGLGLVPDPGIVVMNVGEVTTLNLTLTNGRNPVADVSVSASGLNPVYRVESIGINGTDCTRTGIDQSEFAEYLCAPIAVPANASYPVTVRYRAMQAGVGHGGARITVFTANDAVGTNNNVFFNARTQQLTDIGLGVAQATATATRGTRLRFPLITVTNSGALADDVVVNIPLPAFATVDSISSSGNCAGTTTLQCAFDSVASGASATIDLQLLTSAEGTFTSNVTVVVSNDSTPANNAASVALTVTAPVAPPPGGGSSSSSGGGKKGGGSLEWLALAFLALLARYRVRSVRQQIRVAHERHVRAVR